MIGGVSLGITNLVACRPILNEDIVVNVLLSCQLAEGAVGVSVCLSGRHAGLDLSVEAPFPLLHSPFAGTFRLAALIVALIWIPDRIPPPSTVVVAT